MRNAKKKKLSVPEDSKENEHLLNVDPLLFAKSVSAESDDDQDYSHYPAVTSMTTKIEQIKKGTSKQQRMKRQKIKQIRSWNDFRKWYWQNPFEHFRAIYFFLCFLSAFVFIIYWFMDNDSSYILCGIVGLTMSAYAMFKFKLSINLKKEIDEYKRINLQFKRQNLKMQAHVKRAEKARIVLKKTKRRLIIANNANKDNIIKFEAIEQNMKLAGEKAIKGMGKIHTRSTKIREKWRAQFLNNERSMLQAVYNRFERKHTNKSKLGMTSLDFKEFHEMLPRRYGTRFIRLGAFNTLAGNDSLLDFKQFAVVLDTFAQMEVDNCDIPITPNLSPKHSRKKAYQSIPYNLSPASLADPDIVSD